MKKLTLIALAALFVAVSSVAQSKAQKTPKLSAKKQEAVMKLMNKDSQAKLDKKFTPATLQRQNSLSRQIGRRATFTIAKQKEKASKGLKAQQQNRRAITDPAITTQPAGELLNYARSGQAFYNSWLGIMATQFVGNVGQVVINGNDIYFNGIISQLPANTWVKGTISGSKITVDFPQACYQESGATYYAFLEDYTIEEDGGWYYPSANQQMTLDYDAATGAITTPADSKMVTNEQIVGVADATGSWLAFGDWAISYTKVTDKPVEAPVGMAVEQYALTADDFAGQLVNVGFFGDDVYVQGLCSTIPEAWVKGTIDGDKVTFATPQYFGVDLINNVHQYMVSAELQTTWVEEYEDWYEQWVLIDQPVTFKYDATAKTLTESSIIMVNGSKEIAYYLDIFENANLKPFTEVSATPAAAEDFFVSEGGASYFNNGWGWGVLDFVINTADVDGNFILPEKLSYVIYTKVNGEVKQMEATPWDFIYLDEPMNEFPFGFSDGWDIYTSGNEVQFYYHVVGPEQFGVQIIYRGAGEERRSEIVWADVYEYGAEVQPDAATPAYPDVDPADKGGEISYSYYTGDESEEVTVISNASKPETYDVAIKIQDPAMIGAYIESITFPIQTLDGVSDISVFLTSQLRVENGKNVPDLVSKAVTPEQAGFVTVELDKPYIIPAEGVYVGYSLTITDVQAEENQMPIVVSKGAKEGGLYLHTSDGFLKWLDASQIFDANSTIQVKLGGKVIKENAAGVVPAEPQYVMTGNQFTLPITVKNYGSNGIQSFDVKYTIGNEVGDAHFDVNPAVEGVFGKATTAELTVPAIAVAGNYDLNVEITKVNGVANESEAIVVPVVALNTVPKHRSVLEEYTGLWCGWCPRGLVSLEKLAQLYPDDYVLMSYHNGDEMEIMNSALFPNYVAGFPDAYIDRAQEVDPYYGTGSNEFGVAADLKARSEVFGQANIDVTAELSEDGRQVIVNTDVTFPYDVTDGKYVLEYALLEDGMQDDSWAQSNYYSGDTSIADMAEFAAAGSSVTGLTFNDVVVMMNQIGGIEGSLPAEFNADKPIHHTYTFELEDEFGDALALNTAYEPIIQDKSKLKVAVLLLKEVGGEVVNANTAALGTATVELSNAGYATFYDSEKSYKLPSSLKAYVVSDATQGALTYKEIEGVIPAGVPVLLESILKVGGVFTLSASNSNVTYTGQNMLHGSDVATTTTADGNNLFYKLTFGKSDSSSANTFGWFWGAANGAAFQIEGHRAWLAVPTAKAALGYALNGGETTGINEVVKMNGTDGDVFYDVQGRRVNSNMLNKGVYIHNNKKVIVK